MPRSSREAPLADAPADGGTVRVAQLQRVLMESTDPGERAHAHLELGRISLRGGRFEQAVRHLREALHYDPRLEPARRLLGEMGEASAVVGATKKGSGGALLGLLKRFRRA